MGDGRPRDDDVWLRHRDGHGHPVRARADAAHYAAKAAGRNRVEIAGRSLERG